jgi:pimeloyl-ACP methyl ester carboxylesterase
LEIQMKLACLALVLATTISSGALAQNVPSAITADPATDPAHPASLQAVKIPSHGVEINGTLYRAAGAGPHPTVVLLHGLPGVEQNLDLAQAMRRAGWNVLTLHYRGSWGSPGVFSLVHELEDVQAALAFLKDPTVAAEHQVDARRIVLIGHSVGGLAAAVVGADTPGLLGVGMISAANLGGFADQGEAAVTEAMRHNMETLVGTTPRALAQEIISHQSAWELAGLAPRLSRRPLLLVTSNDGMADSSQALGKAVLSAGGAATQAHLATDHNYSDKRIALQAAVLAWLQALPAAPPLP